MPPVTLREFFRKHVIDIDAVRDERDAAIEEARQPGAIASPEDVEKFCYYGLFPRVGGQRRPLWPISIERPVKAPSKLTALGRIARATGDAWRQLVRELCTGTLVVTGKLHPEADRQKIGPETWLDDDLYFDPRANTICTAQRNDGFGSPAVVPRWFEVQVRELTAVVSPRRVRKSTAIVSPRRRGVAPMHEWDKATEAITTRVATDGPLPRKRDGTPNKAAAKRLLLDYFQNANKSVPTGRRVEQYLQHHPFAWWGFGPE